MRKLLTILILVSSIQAIAQKPDTLALSRCVRMFHKALVDKDTTTLSKLLRDDVHYYHSNGMLQMKRDVIGDLSGKLYYKLLNTTPQGIHLMGDIAQAKMTADVQAVMNGKEIQLKLKIVQVWIWKDGNWEMYSRHSEKIVAQ